MDGTAIVTGEVRELIRRSGIDPARDRVRVRSLVRDAVADYDERSLTGSLPPLADPAGTARRVFDEVAGFGPLQALLDDPAVEEFWINEPGRVLVARGGVNEATDIVLGAEEVRDLVERMLTPSGRRVDLSRPFVDAALPDGSRLHVVIPDVTRSSWVVNVRKFVARASTLTELVALGTLTSRAAGFLAAAVAAGLNVLVSGGTQAGKTTLLGCLVAAVPPRERVLTCEEVFELRVERPDTVGMQCRQPSLEGTGEIRLSRLVTEALRMRPDRIVVGEVRREESLDLLLALNSGLPGMCTVHANSAREAVLKMCTLPLLAGENVSDRFIVPTVAGSIDLVVHLELGRDGGRRVREIAAVPGRVVGGEIEIVDVFTERDGDLVPAGGMPPHPDRFARAGIPVAALLDPAAPGRG